METLYEFLVAKRQQAALLGHELRNPFIGKQRYDDIYDMVYQRVKRKEGDDKMGDMGKFFGKAIEKRPEADSAGPNDSYPVYRMFDIVELGTVATKVDVAPACQSSGQCVTAVGLDLTSNQTIREALLFLDTNLDIRVPQERRDLARILAEPFFLHPETKKMEHFIDQEDEEKARKTSHPYQSPAVDADLSYSGALPAIADQRGSQKGR